jgi:hypothetical protein
VYLNNISDEPAAIIHGIERNLFEKEREVVLGERTARHPSEQVGSIILDDGHRDIGALFDYPNGGFSVLFPQL